MTKPADKLEFWQLLKTEMWKLECLTCRDPEVFKLLMIRPASIMPAFCDSKGDALFEAEKHVQFMWNEYGESHTVTLSEHIFVRTGR